MSLIANMLVTRGRRQLRSAGNDTQTQRFVVSLGHDVIEVVLTQPPHAPHRGKPHDGRAKQSSSPYVIWAPLPHDTPRDGAFACLGASDKGCLFIDLASAPGAVAINGDRPAVTRLAESIACQLSTPPSTSACSVAIVGAALREPCPSAAVWVASIHDLESANVDAHDRTEIVFCELWSDDDAFALANYIRSAQRRVIPIALADLPDAPWSFTVRSAQATSSRRSTFSP